MKTNKAVKELMKQSLVDNTTKEERPKVELWDFDPKEMFMPDKYYTVTMKSSDIVHYFNKGDILIVDPAIKDVKESGIYVFEYKGYVFVRQFQVMPFGYKDIQNKKVFRSVSCHWEDYFPADEVNIIGAVVSKQVEMFHGLYYKKNRMCGVA
jgi:hypothetical protein